MTIATVNKEYRAKDESHLWPIKGMFNVTNRAIVQARTFRRNMGIVFSDEEYAELLNMLISKIVNS